MASRTAIAPHPVLSSPGRLALAGFGFTLLVYAIQIESGVPPWLDWSPVELSSNIVALFGFVWTALQLMGARHETARRAWLAAAAGMALLSVEGDVGELFGLESHGAHEMSLSVALWLAGAALVFRAGARFATRRSVRETLRAGLVIQLTAQAVGLWTAYDAVPDSATEVLAYFNDTGELVAVIAYLIALLLAAFAPTKSYAAPPTEIGAKGRAIFRDFQLRHAGPHPTRQAAPVRTVGLFVEIAGAWRRSALFVARAGGPTRASQLVHLIRCAASGVGAQSYYRIALFRSPHLASALAASVARDEASNGLVAAAGAARPDGQGPGALRDRVAFASLCRDHGLPVRPVLALVENGAPEFLAAQGAFDRDLLVLARRGGGGFELRREGPLMFRDGEGELVNFDMALARLAAASRLGDLVVAPRLAPHADVAGHARLGPVCFHVLTCLDEGGSPVPTHALMRVDDASGLGRWDAAIDVGSGAFGDVVAAGAPPAWRSFADPATGALVSGRLCAGWADLMRTAIDAHRVFDGCALVGWELALTPEGPLLLGGDPEPDLEAFQACAGVPIGGSRLAPLLDRRLDRLVAARS